MKDNESCKSLIVCVLCYCMIKNVYGLHRRLDGRRGERPRHAAAMPTGMEGIPKGVNGGADDVAAGTAVANLGTW